MVELLFLEFVENNGAKASLGLRNGAEENLWSAARSKEISLVIYLNAFLVAKGSKLSRNEKYLRIELRPAYSAGFRQNASWDSF